MRCIRHILISALLALSTDVPGLESGDLYVTVWDADKAYNGTTLFADGHDPANSRIVEVDMLGNVVWEWFLPAGLKGYTNPGFDAELLSNGNILVTLPGKGIREVDRNGTIHWSHDDSNISHDADRLDDGTTLYVYGNADGPEDAAVKRVTTNGTTVWEWYGTNEFMVAPYWPSNNVTREGWIHVNGATRMSDGRTLISPRNFNQTIIVDTNAQVEWAIDYTNLYSGVYDPPTQLGYDPHDPELSEDETRLLVCLQRSTPYQVIELDVNARTSTWEYARHGLRTCRDANRLPNGNVLIVGVMTTNVADDSVLFEVTPDGEIVWELRFFDLDATLKPGYFFKATRLTGWPDTDDDGIVDETDTDDDNDGHSDLQEAIAGTNPTNEADVFTVLAISNTALGELAIYWCAQTGRSYRVYSHTGLDLSAWPTVPVHQVSGQGEAAAYTNAGGGGRRYYRLGVSFD